MNFEDLSGNQLVELYGSEMGFSLKKLGRTVTRVAKKTVVRPVSSAAKFVGRNAGNIAVVATAVPTGGLSLLAKKSARDAVGSTARFTQKKIIRPVSHVVASNVVRPGASLVANVARSDVAQNLLKNAVSFVPGGSTALTAARTASNLFPSKRSPAAPSAPAPRKESVAEARLRHHRTPATQTPDEVPAAQAPHSGLSLPLMLGIGGVGLAGLLLAVSMGKKKG